MIPHFLPATIEVSLLLDDWAVVLRESQRLRIPVQEWLIRAIEIEIATCEAARLSVKNPDAIPFGSSESTEASDHACETPPPNARSDADA